MPAAFAKAIRTPAEYDHTDAGDQVGDYAEQSNNQRIFDSGVFDELGQPKADSIETAGTAEIDQAKKQ